MDRLDVLALEMGSGFAETRTAIAELRANCVELRSETRASHADTPVRHATLMDAIANLRKEYRNQTHDD